MHRGLTSSYELTVGEFDISLIHHCIAHGGINFHMAKKLLNLLHGHPFIDSHCGKRSTELMRMDSGDLQPAAKLAEPNFNSRNLKPLVRFV